MHNISKSAHFDTHTLNILQSARLVALFNLLTLVLLYDTALDA